MSLFTESSWEANAVGDKLSKELFQNKNKKSKKGGKINGSGSVSPKKNHIPLKNVQKSTGTKVTNKSVKRKAKQREKALAIAVASGEATPKKWARKSKQHNQNIVSTLNLTKKQDQSEKQEPPTIKQKNVAKTKSTIRREKVEKPTRQSVNKETKSQRRRKQQKLKKIAETLKCNSAKVEGDESQRSDKKSSPIKNLNIKKLEMMLAVKEKTANERRKEAKAPESLRERMMSQLRASRFRFLNETLYNNESSESKKYFKEDPDAFAAYHAGYRQQVEHWPLNPLDVIISSIKKMPKEHIIADFGCGEARLTESVSQKVHSFDLVAVNEKVKACDMAHTPLLTAGVNVVVFCLSLMGTNLADYLLEANRVLKKDGLLKIADVESRFENVDEFIKLLESYGFVNTWKDLSHNLFYFMDFKKSSEVNRSTKKLPQIELKACLYKKR